MNILNLFRGVIIRKLMDKGESKRSINTILRKLDLAEAGVPKMKNPPPPPVNTESPE